ncbi:MAG: hypothetical protein ACKN8Y_06825, partial [Polynucleobacter victoriensis]
MATKQTTSPSIKTKAVVKSSVAKKSVGQKATTKSLKAPTRSSKKPASQAADLDVMFDLAAETFRVMSAPMRLKIINCLCSEEKNVGQLLDEIDTTQPN